VGGDLGVGRAPGGEARNLRLLRRQIQSRPLCGLTGAVADREQFGPGPVSERHRAHGIEQGTRGAQL
jgi:hypothetical protein